MDILEYLSLQTFKQDYLVTAIMLFGESEVYTAIAFGIVIADDIGIKINIQ